MIILIHTETLGLFYYWKKPVTGHPGQYRQIHQFIARIKRQDWIILSPGKHRNGFQGDNERLIACLYSPGFILIPIAFRHTPSPCLYPAVSSLGACPTPAP